LVLGLTLMWQLLFLAAAEWARRAGDTALTAGFADIVAFYTPLSVYSLERLLGVGFDYRYEEFYPWISEGWVWMEVTAIAVAVALIYRYRHPFLHSRSRSSSASWRWTSERGCSGSTSIRTGTVSRSSCSVWVSGWLRRPSYSTIAGCAASRSGRTSVRSG
jgi:hypothetical protein